jgi:hypothetical protein
LLNRLIRFGLGLLAHLRRKRHQAESKLCGEAVDIYFFHVATNFCRSALAALVKDGFHKLELPSPDWPSDSRLFLYHNEKHIIVPHERQHAPPLAKPLLEPARVKFVFEQVERGLEPSRRHAHFMNGFRVVRLKDCAVVYPQSFQLQSYYLFERASLGRGMWIRNHLNRLRRY